MRVGIPFSLSGSIVVVVVVVILVLFVFLFILVGIVVAVVVGFWRFFAGGCRRRRRRRRAGVWILGIADGRLGVPLLSLFGGGLLFRVVGSVAWAAGIRRTSAAPIPSIPLRAAVASLTDFSSDILK